MTKRDLTIFIVDDDASVRDALSLVFSVRGYRTAAFAKAEDFLNTWQTSWMGCLLLDIRMPGMDGLTLQERLIESECTLPVVIITGHGDVDSARRAFKSKAIDFLEKPIDHEKMFEAIEQAFNLQSLMHEKKLAGENARHRLALLTPREHEVMNMVVLGYHNREIAEKLGISARTVEVHKAHVMSKLDVASVADLVRMSMRNT